MKMDEDSGEFSEGLDEFEKSIDEPRQKPLKNQTTFSNKPYDEAIELSQDLSMAESFDARDKNKKEMKLVNDRYDEAFEVSQSMDQSAAAPPKRPNHNPAPASKAASIPEEKESKGESKPLQKTEASRSQTVLINSSHFDEALEFSQSGSEESVATDGDSPGRHRHHKPAGAAGQQTAAQQQHQAELQRQQQIQQQQLQQQQHQQQQQQQQQQQIQQLTAAQRAAASSLNTQDSPPSKRGSQSRSHQDDGDDDGEDDDGDVEESYDNIEGAYNARDYQQLNVPMEVRDLFQYIERYKPHEVLLETPLHCFIPEYIPAIGELDAFIKVPRPDGREDGLGLRFLDEPSSNQSDPTVLELQLRAKSKKLQYGDVAVRSIEHADKNPAKIEKWVNDIRELHRSKPPPQVNYKKNMPDIDALMEAWPEEFEQLLATSPLPSPDLDLSIAEYARVLCSLLDIPTYDNPIESLHLLFSLYIDFRNNPHFQARMFTSAHAHGGGGAGGAAAQPKNGLGAPSYGNNYGHADVLEIDQGDEYK